MTVSSHLTSLASNLVLSSAENTSISTSISTLSSRLNSYFCSGVNEDFKFGSSTRGTILPRIADGNSDIDYMIVFDTSGGEKQPQTYLDRLKNFANARYSTSEVKQSSPTIVLSLNHINFELVPAIKDYWSGYKIPAPASAWSSWIGTNPSGFNQQLVSANQNNNNQIKPLVRLVKYWNAKNGHMFASFSIEQHIVGMSFYWCSSLRDYFYSFWSNFNCSWDSPQYVKNKVSAAKNYAREAKEHEDRGMPVNAETSIKKIVPEL